METVLSLLKAAIWDRIPEGPADADWDLVAETAQKVYVLALVADRILRMEPDGLTGTARDRFTDAVRKAAYLNTVMASVIVNTFTKLEKAGFHPVLLKGHSIAMSYPEPGLRQCKDIDIFVGKERFNEAVGLVFDKGQKLEREERHVNAKIGGISIELHHTSLLMPGRRAAAAYAGYEKECLENGCGEITILGHRIAVPDPTFHAFFLAYHTWGHLMLCGIVLRQLSDLCMFLDRHHDSIDTERLREMVASTGFMAQWRILVSACTGALGLDPAKAPLHGNIPQWKIRHLMSMAFKESKLVTPPAAGKCRIARRLRSWYIYTGHFITVLPLCPLTTVRMYVRFMTRQLSRLKFTD